MKHAYGISAVDTIKKYTVTDKEIIATSLTDVDYSVSLEDEHILIKMMIEQAKERNEKVEFKKLRNNLNLVKSRIISELGMIAINAAVPIMNNDSEEILSLFKLAIVLSSALLTLDIKDYIEDKKEYDEFEKYKIYLNIREDLEKISFVLNGLKQIPTKYININTLDNYSLKDIKKIKKFLEQTKNNYNNEISNKKKIK